MKEVINSNWKELCYYRKWTREDIESYNRLKEAGKLIGINVLDSIIVGESYYSFTENGI